MSSTFNANYIDQAKATRLSLRLRVAWGTRVCQSVIDLYSSYFRTKYRQTETFRLLVDFVDKKELNTELVHELVESIGDLQEAADDEDYTGDVLWPSILLMEELFSKTGKDCVQAIDYAALAYANLCIFKQGLCSYDPTIPTDYYYSLTDSIYAFSRTVFSACESACEAEFDMCLLQTYTLEMRFVPLLPVLVMSRTTEPPIHEL